MSTERTACPCCGHRTLDGARQYEICPCCFWMDEPSARDDPQSVGANGLPLAEAQRNYREYGASERQWQRHVRQPAAGEERDPEWRPVEE